MQIPRPDLSDVPPTVRAYIEALEAELAELGRLRASEVTPQPSVEPDPPLEPGEPPTSLNVITVSATGVAKRTPRHLYGRQHRDGMGVFDLDVPEDDPPAFLAVADQDQTLLLLTNTARAFRVPVGALSESAVRSRGQSLVDGLPLEAGERLTAVLPARERGYLALLSRRGMVRTLRHHFVGTGMAPGTTLYNLKEFGLLATACWTSGEADLFVATRQGRAIRFPEKALPVQGGPGIRLEGGDVPVAIVGVGAHSSVLLLGADGRGAVRSMSGFSANKVPGAGGKAAMKTDQLVTAAAVEEGDDVLIISRLSKIIRFPAAEVPVKEGVVQGVNCMALRADEVAALAVTKL